jgi:hypothetical protein
MVPRLTRRCPPDWERPSRKAANRSSTSRRIAVLDTRSWPTSRATAQSLVPATQTVQRPGGGAPSRPWRRRRRPTSSALLPRLCAGVPTFGGGRPPCPSLAGQHPLECNGPNARADGVATVLKPNAKPEGEAVATPQNDGRRRRWFSPEDEARTLAEADTAPSVASSVPCCAGRGSAVPPHQLAAAAEDSGVQGLQPKRPGPTPTKDAKDRPLEGHERGPER